MALSSHQRIDSSMPGKETNPHTPSLWLPLPSTTPGRPCRLTQPSLSLFPPTQSAQPLTHPPHPPPPPSSAHRQPRRTALPSSVVSLPSDGQLSRYELTELRSFCGGRASSYAAYQLENVSVALRSPVVVPAFPLSCPLAFPAIHRYEPLIYEIAPPLPPSPPPPPPTPLPSPHHRRVSIFRSRISFDLRPFTSSER